MVSFPFLICYAPVLSLFSWDGSRSLVAFDVGR